MTQQEKQFEPDQAWDRDERWKSVRRPYGIDEVLKLRGSMKIEYTLASHGARRLWDLLHQGPYVSALGALTGGQAIQQVQAGLQAIYVSGWQVAADNNSGGQTYPDQSLYAADSVPALVRRINNAFQRADQINHLQGNDDTYWFAPIVADAEAGFGGVLNAFELMKAMIEAGAAAVHFEDQLSSVKKCGHMGGKVLVPTSEAISKLIAARLAADVLGVPTLIIARTDARGATLITSDIDERDRPFLTGERAAEGYYTMKSGLESAITRALSYAPYADLLWYETSEPSLEEARKFSEWVNAEFPGKLMAYNLSPSFNWQKKLDQATIRKFQRELGAYGYKFQFVTLAGFHSLNLGMYELARGFQEAGMSAYSRLQESEFEREKEGYRAVKHQAFVGTGYFDSVAQAIHGDRFSTSALKGSTEEEQFTTESFIELTSAIGSDSAKLDIKMEER